MQSREAEKNDRRSGRMARKSRRIMHYQHDLMIMITHRQKHIYRQIHICVCVFVYVFVCVVCVCVCMCELNLFYLRHYAGRIRTTSS